MKSLGAQIDALYDLEQEINEAERQVRELKQQRAKKEANLLRQFGKEDIDGCKGTRGVASIRTAQFPSIKDRRKFERYVIKNRAFDLFQARVASRAYFDRIEEGEEIPGVKVFERISVSIRRRVK
jgi:hypothetical protein